MWRKSYTVTTYCFTVEEAKEYIEIATNDGNVGVIDQLMDLLEYVGNDYDGEFMVDDYSWGVMAMSTEEDLIEGVVDDQLTDFLAVQVAEENTWS